MALCSLPPQGRNSEKFELFFQYGLEKSSFKTAEFNKDAKLLQADILSGRAALSQGEMSALKTATALLDISK